MKATRSRFHILGIAAGYFGFAKLSLLTAYLPAGPTPVWIPSGFALAMALILGRRAVAGILLGAAVMTITLKVSLPGILVLCLADIVEPMLGSYLLRRYFKFSGKFSTLRDVIGLLLGGALVSTAVGATIGVTGLSVIGVIPWERLGESWLNWWAPAVLSDLVVAPAFLIWTAQPPAREKKGIGPLLESVLICLLGVFVATHVFLLSPTESKGIFPYWIFPFVIWLATRMGFRAAVIGTLAISVFSVWGAATGRGPFVGKTPQEGLILVQEFLAITALTGMLLATAIAEREEAIVARSELVAQLKSAIQLRDDFLSIASHELKTPLTSLSIQIQLINQMLERGGLERLSPEKAMELVRVSKQQLDRFAVLVNELLDASRIVVGQMPLQLEEFDLVEQTSRVIQQFQVELKSSGSTVEHFGDSQLIGRWDHLRMKQVIVNLLSNAIKYGAGKPIEVTTKRVGDHAIIRIRDHGMGIAKEDQIRIFDRFERAVSLRSFGGLGLGLYIARQIVRAHGGRIQLESELGKGATFIVELPLTPVAQAPGEREGSPQRAQS